jgi:hypothetical protein
MASSCSGRDDGLRNLGVFMSELVLKLSKAQVEVVLKSLNQVCQGVEAASVILPVFAEIQKQTNEQLEPKQGE